MRVLKTLTVFIIILISNFVRICAEFKLLNIKAEPQCEKEFHRPPKAIDSRNVKVTAVLGSADGSSLSTRRTATGPCGQRITLNPLLDEINIDKGIYYVGYFYNNHLSSFIKKIPDDCEYVDYKKNNYNCEFGKFTPHVNRRDEIPKLYEELLNLSKTENSQSN